MSSGGRKDKPEPSPPQTGVSPTASDDGLLTAEDLFGDMVDAPLSAEPGATSPTQAPPRKGPIRVQVAEPGVAKKAPAPFADKGKSEVLPEDVAALLDAFSGPAEAATRAAATDAAAPELDPLLDALGAAEAPPTEAPEAPAREAAPLAAPLPAEGDAGEVDALLDDLGEPPSPPAAAEAEALLEEMLAPAPAPEPPKTAPPAAKPLAPDMTLPPMGADAFLDLEALHKALPARADGDLPKPAARIGTKFQAAPPKAPKVVEEGGLDLAALAEDAMSLEPTPAGGPPASPDKPSVAAEPPLPHPEPVAAGENAYGPYRLLEKIAVGGMAEVFKAKRSGVEGFEKVAAVKRILPHLSDNKEFVDMFIDEAKMVAGLAHPNIVQIFDLGKIEKTYYIAMEYVHGRDLRSIQRRAKDRGIRVPLDLSVLVVNKVCSALEYAHRKKDDKGRPMRIVHRDISPQNILISFEGDVKLTDFGIAKAASKATTTDRGALRGKLLYMSPEQAWGKPMDRRSDIFSLGIVFYELITDQKPFLGSSEMSILEMVRECRVSPPTTLNPRVPETLERVVMKSLERDADQRYQDAAEMLKDLERALHERRVPAAAELAKFMEVLFDQDERGDAVPDDHSSGEHRSGGSDRHLEIELDSSPSGEAGRKTDEGTASGSPRDPMSIQKLLKRFGIK